MAVVTVVTVTVRPDRMQDYIDQVACPSPSSCWQVTGFLIPGC